MFVKQAKIAHLEDSLKLNSSIGRTYRIPNLGFLKRLALRPEPSLSCHSVCFLAWILTLLFKYLVAHNLI